MPLKGFLRRVIEKRKINYPEFRIRIPKYFINIPSFKDIEKVNVKYPLIEPLAYANIKWNPVQKELVYHVLEPVLSPKEKEDLEKIKNSLVKVIDIKLSDMKNEYKAIKYLEKNVKSILEDLDLIVSPETYIKIMYYIFRDFIGLNEIEPLMHDPYIEDIGCDGLNTPIYIVHRKFGSIKTNIVYKDLDYLSNFVIKLSERCGRYISYSRPLLDGSLPDGSRVQATLAKDVTTKGPTFSIRRFRENPISPIELINMGTVSPGIMAYLWTAVQYGSSMLICGGVATGKTTILNCITMFIPPEQKIVSIEDTRELNLPHENWIPAVSRMGFGISEESKSYGEVNLFDLLKESFRQNPDYVIVGEVRGKEAYVMFQGIASGHPSIGTIHAGSMDDVMKRLSTPPIELSPSLIESLDLIVVMIHAREKGKSARRVKEIVEISSIDPKTGMVHTVRPFFWIASIDSFEQKLMESNLIQKISREKGIPYEKLLKEINMKARILEWMQRHNITKFSDVSKIINLYYKGPETVIEWVEKDISPTELEVKRKIEEVGKTITGLRVFKI